MGYTHVNSLEDVTTTPTEEPVGDQQDRQTAGRGNDRSASKLVVSMTEQKRIRPVIVLGLTWADVVKFSSSQQSTNRSKIVSGSFSRNNLNCKTKV